jgi:hypothetical protein
MIIAKANRLNHSLSFVSRAADVERGRLELSTSAEMKNISVAQNYACALKSIEDRIRNYSSFDDNTQQISLYLIGNLLILELDVIVSLEVAPPW